MILCGQQAEAKAQAREMEWKLQSAEWKQMTEEQIAKLKAQAEEYKRRMLGAEEKWKGWAEESVGSLTTERDEAIQSELDSHQAREKVQKDMKLTQHSVEVLAAIEAHQRAALVDANAAISKVSSDPNHTLPQLSCVW